MSAEPLPIVLVHGAGESGAVWEPWRPLLAPHRMLAPSLPGRAGVPGPPLSRVEDAAAFVARFASEQGASRFVVCGYSYGGAIALELAITHADRVAGLALVSTGARLRVHPRIFEALEAGRDPMKPGEAWSSPVPIESALADWRAANGFDRLGQPLEVRVPALVVGGECDVLTPPRNASYLVERIAGAELLMVPSEGHTVPFDQPAIVAAAVKRLTSSAR
jgi:pimeloyl-ACP methyl ester carboxylesterase